MLGAVAEGSLDVRCEVVQGRKDVVKPVAMQQTKDVAHDGAVADRN
jgi:hypothetical protein